MSDYIGPLTVPTHTHFAEVNGCKVTTATAMPEPVLNALAALVDALGSAFKARDDADREADAELLRRPCQRHVGQYANYCGPCRSEQIGLDPDEIDQTPADEPSRCADCNHVSAHHIYPGGCTVGSCPCLVATS